MSVYENVRNEPSLNQVLNDIHKDAIALDTGEVKNGKAILNDIIINDLIPEMKKVDVPFAAIYERVFYAGSVYDGLKISEFDEFDLNIVLKLPVSIDEVVVVDKWNQKEQENEAPYNGHAFYKATKDLSLIFHHNHHKKLGQLLFTDKQQGLQFLSPMKVKSWFQSVVEKALNNIKPKVFADKTDVSITTRGSGPAWTLSIKSSCHDVDIDLVPVFYFQDHRTDSMVYLVPKPPQEDEWGKLQWRLSYAEKERRILHNNSCAKKVIKLLKRLRDMQGAPWKKLCSYHLKNFVILEIGNYSWNETELGVVFISLLKRLHQYLSNGKMPSNFDEDHNIVVKIDENTLENIRNKLDKIIKDIERNRPIEMRKYFVEHRKSEDSVTNAE